jgi:peroxiredoxin Q/BCP
MTVPVLLVALLACSKEPPPSTSSSTSAAATATTPATAPGELAVGATAPDFSAKAHDGTDIKISALKGKPVVVYFYPKDETPGCTKEACAFRDAWKELAATGVVLVGISSDTLDSHKKFAENHKLPFHLVSDGDGSIAKSYGVPNNLGYLGRQTFVIAADGKLKKIYRSVDVANHAKEILADVKS